MNIFDFLNEETVKLLPRTGNPFVDGLVQFGARKMITQRQAQGQVIEGTVIQRDGRWLIDQIRAQPSGVFLISGPRGSGKTAWAVSLAQELGRRTFAVNMPHTLPWIEKIQPDEIENCPASSVIILDDSGMVAGSQDYHTAVNQMLHRLIALTRHVEITLIANTQSTSMLDKYFLDCDCIFLKRPSMLLMEIERPAIRKLLERCARAFDAVSLSLEDEKRFIYAYSDYRFRWEGLLEYSLPNGYTDRISRNKA